jgi:hypothetical protein
MFDTIADRIKQEEGPSAKGKDLIVRIGLVLLVAVVLFGGLYLFIQHLE